MKKRILFVDDEVNILKGLKRSLRPRREYWDMAFIEEGQNALDLLEKESFDVIVSDMRMPGMDGVQLLQAVQKKYPGMVRIILSGHSDREMIMNSVKSAHQYLSKPCETKALITTITRSCSLHDILYQEELERLLGKIQTLPSLPVLYARIMEAVQSEDTSAADIGAIISKDMGMTAKVLQLINSSFFGMPRHISDVREAVVMLGIDVVKTLVLNIEVFSQFSRQAMSVISVDEIHGHCIRTAQIAQRIAGVENLDKKMVENGMMAAMLHDLGKLILAEYFFLDYKKVMQKTREDNTAVFKAEKEIFSVSHAEVGAYLLGLWGLPESIIEAIAFHHDPGKIVSSEFELCGLLHVADLLAYQQDWQTGGEGVPGGLDTGYMEKQGMSGRFSVWQDSPKED